MKLQTSIEPRRDGTVLVTGQDGKKYTFSDDGYGDLVCVIDHEPTLAKLLTLQHFFPVSTEDFTAARRLANAATDLDGVASDAGEPSLSALAAKPDADLDEDDDEGDMAGLPIEANTPLQAAPDRAARKNGALQTAAKTVRK